MKKTIVILSHVGFDKSPYCNYVHSHAKALAEQGYNVIVLAIISWIPILSKLQKRKKEFMKRIKGENKIQKIDGVTVIYKKAMTFSNLLYNSRLNLNGIFYYLSIKRLFKKIYKKENVVLLDAHTFRTEGYVASKLKKHYRGLTTTVTLHGTSFLRNTKTKNGIRLINKILNSVDYSVCVSDMLKNIATTCGAKNAITIYNGVNQHEFEKVNKEDYKYNIITVGSLIPRKKHDITIQAIEKLYKKYPKIRLNIVGFGVEKENLTNLVKEKKLEEVVTFKGEISNNEVLELMNKSYVFILPSVAEGFGIVYIEAMKAGTIAIATKGEGIDGFIKNGKNGFLVNPDADEIADLICDIYAGKYDIEKIRGNAYKDAEQLTWTNNAKNYINLLKKN